MSMFHDIMCDLNVKCYFYYYNYYIELILFLYFVGPIGAAAFYGAAAADLVLVLMFIQVSIILCFI